MDFDEAVSALVDGDDAGDTASTTAPVEPEPTSKPDAEPSDPGASDDQPTAESFTGIDPESLPDELKELYKSMQGDYTRKSQEYAPWRSLAEQGIDPETAGAAASWYAALQSDPNAAVRFHEQLGAQLSEAGLLDGAGGEGDFDFDNFEDDDADGAGNPLAQELGSLRQQVEQMQMQQQFAQQANVVASEEAAIRQANPAYKQEDIDSIYELAIARDSGLTDAQTAYEGMRNRILSEYVATKSSVPAGGHVAATAHAQEPSDTSEWFRKDGDIDFEKLDRAAAEALANANA